MKRNFKLSLFSQFLLSHVVRKQFYYVFLKICQPNISKIDSINKNTKFYCVHYYVKIISMLYAHINIRVRV